MKAHVRMGPVCAAVVPQGKKQPQTCGAGGWLSVEEEKLEPVICERGNVTLSA